MIRGSAAALLVAVAAPLLAVGCGSAAAGSAGGDVEANTTRGKELFVQECGSCHALADAGTQGRIGPDLDEALDDVRAQGFDESTIRDMVRGQIAYPVVEPPTDAPGMPRDLVTGDDAVDVAAYVASVAGTGTQGRTASPAGARGGSGEEIFTANCGSCHVLAAAGTSGTIGPNLDESQVTLDQALEQIRKGGGGMPPFEDQLNDAQIRAVAEYVLESRGS